jgi:putative endonuclease
LQLRKNSLIVQRIVPIAIGKSFLPPSFFVNKYRGYMPFVYIIKSMKTESFYIGKTYELEQRLLYHNTAELNKGASKQGIPWQYYFTLEVPTYALAGKLEMHIKGMKSREYCMNLVKYPEISQKLIEKYS